MKLKDRLKTPVPNLIRKVQKLTGAIGGLSTVILAMTAQYPDLHVPSWIWKAILGATLLNHVILQLTTENDFQTQSNTGEEEEA